MHTTSMIEPDTFIRVFGIESLEGLKIRFKTGLPVSEIDGQVAIINYATMTIGTQTRRFLYTLTITPRIAGYTHVMVFGDEFYIIGGN